MTFLDYPNEVILSAANPRSDQCLLLQATSRVAEPMTGLRKHLGGGRC
jgi:hypothetical protein